jgi:CRISPR type III-A-associated RAMP protein Csm4
MTEAWHLRFTGPLRLSHPTGLPERSEIIIHSDTLKSALFAVGLQIYPEWAGQADNYFNAFSISSAFPFCGEEYFLPRPQWPVIFRFSQTDEALFAKKAKKIQYVSAAFYDSFYKNLPAHSFAQPPVLDVDNSQVVQGQFLSSRSQPSGRVVWETVVEPHAAKLEDPFGSPRYFTTSRTFFAQDCGLYFLIRFHDETWRGPLLNAMRLLGHQGMGSDRSVGNVFFDFHPERDIKSPLPFGLPDQDPPDQAGLYVALGMYLPTQEDLERAHLDESSWTLVRRGGYLAAPENPEHMRLRRNWLMMMGPGSVLKCTASPVGKMVDLRPEVPHDPVRHPVWRDGRCLFWKLG